MEKRGLSTIVATLILILLSLVAVGIVWVAVSNILKSGSEQANTGASSFLINLELQKVQVEANGDLSIFVKRNVGKGDLSGVYFLVSDGTNQKGIPKDANLVELGSQSFTLSSSEIAGLGLAGIKEVSIAPIIKSGSGKGTIGNVLATHVLTTYDNSREYNTIFLNNLITDPLFTSHSYWTGTWVVDSVALEEAELELVSSAKINVTNSSVQVYSDYVPVDPNKKYRFTLWIKQSSTNSHLYFGYDVYNSTKTEINSYNSAGTALNNYYFWNGDVTPSNSWKKITSYIMPCTPTTWTNPSDATGVNYRMDCSTAFLKMRFLNYGGSPTYGTGIGSITAWYALPRIEEVE